MSARKSPKKTDQSKAATDTLVRSAKKKSSRSKKAPQEIAAAGTSQVSAPEAGKPYVVIDYPVTGETVSGLHYAIRIGASDNGSVQIQFNDSEWLPCRSAAGFWWYDWGYFTPGDYKIFARIVDNEGKQVKKSAATKVQVV